MSARLTPAIFYSARTIKKQGNANKLQDRTVNAWE